MVSHKKGIGLKCAYDRVPNRPANPNAYPRYRKGMESHNNAPSPPNGCNEICKMYKVNRAKLNSKI